MQFRCSWCGCVADRRAGDVNRALRGGINLYCGRVCFGLSHRENKTELQRKAEKQRYDAQRRINIAEELKAIKAAYHKRTYDPVKAAKTRKERMPYHVEYCRRPEYRRWKSEYDRRYRAAEYGPFGEAYLLSIELNRVIKQRSSNYDIRIDNGTYGKTQKRKRGSAASLGGRA